MPVWHSSVARIADNFQRVLSLREWTRGIKAAARKVALDQVRGIGGQWELWQEGESAIHYRRRLSVEEMKLLHQVNSSCPVFTHGAALKVMQP